MTTSQPQSGYTLPVFACAAASAALQWLRQSPSLDAVSLDLIEPPETVKIPIEQVAGIGEGMALAITRSNPGDNLDLTRNTPVWALVEFLEQRGQGDKLTRGEGGKGEFNSSLLTPHSSLSYAEEQIILKGAEGIGHQVNAGGQAAIYGYAQQLIKENLKRQLKPEEKIQVTIILPEGRQLAERTSNSAFGVVEGLSLLGTTGIAQPLSAPGQLEVCQAELEAKASKFNCLVFCLGENGLDLAQQLGMNPEQLVKTANWLGSLLVAAGAQKMPAILLFGYHGKLIKLAGGIFHTHHHLADGRLEILTAYCAHMGIPMPRLREIFASATTETALHLLREWDAQEGSNWANGVYGVIAAAIDRRSQDYIRKYSEQFVRVGSVLFDRDRQIIVQSDNGTALLSDLC
ncbi:MAG: cobalt-precorrin-5B (C(1))-methyltransferase [Cyanobacteria bacterium QH_9_48_43]|nr:MAG: cobalt-precorrin-5B (C(1))-methyltransferase [Cyanobacteria bacterium QH_2_48_84]PSO69932.1 MAG: cobalt-precorrin-5B (C(1))-methyltransferase [Cyanobacteria bacterium QH_3_48_40]PSO81011.1 MAG: cobalt-precorrin-5B (C(1))-methyltransferase [Cyanobacteria bacterium QH_9_48_43]PSO82095.1 MAG: cobalt-precorrin-5B (C(1))-methyltransferase [Cyanobacteria bacterium QS_4_48_99]PSO97261.1 MAG: cobalt-precorrin-5B (C(1))-methyltransferase [Cyanobacteria bacterium SW_12_48_29]PSP29243.1 MAG: coba